jgi:hypothetical protein
LIALNDNISDIVIGSDEKEDHVIQFGTVFRDALARDPRGLPVGQIMPSTIERGLFSGVLPLK